ncbi:hypothetical protein NDU88_002590 [Pleurodeles waltl]|uniref:Uncharacterized protein n=1 Tax=Pleurodeles waltl TaxID=8319 RepID=A0AAV7KT30_PLEWA|nr:hypothetical protein NDU88_002590 [Pleurodeles waltl]
MSLLESENLGCGQGSSDGARLIPSLRSGDENLRESVPSPGRSEPAWRCWTGGPVLGAAGPPLRPRSVLRCRPLGPRRPPQHLRRSGETHSRSPTAPRPSALVLRRPAAPRVASAEGTGRRPPPPSIQPRVEPWAAAGLRRMAWELQGTSSGSPRCGGGAEAAGRGPGAPEGLRPAGRRIIAAGGAGAALGVAGAGLRTWRLAQAGALKRWTSGAALELGRGRLPHLWKEAGDHEDGAGGGGPCRLGAPESPCRAERSRHKWRGCDPTWSVSRPATTLGRHHWGHGWGLGEADLLASLSRRGRGMIDGAGDWGGIPHKRNRC